MCLPIIRHRVVDGHRRHDLQPSTLARRGQNPFHQSHNRTLDLSSANSVAQEWKHWCSPAATLLATLAKPSGVHPTKLHRHPYLSMIGTSLDQIANIGSAFPAWALACVFVQRTRCTRKTPAFSLLSVTEHCIKKSPSSFAPRSMTRLHAL